MCKSNILHIFAQNVTEFCLVFHSESSKENKFYKFLLRSMKSQEESLDSSQKKKNVSKRVFSASLCRRTFYEELKKGKHKLFCKLLSHEGL